MKPIEPTSDVNPPRLTASVQDGRVAVLIESLANDADAWLFTHRAAYVIAAAVICVITFIGYSHAKFPWVDEVLQMIIARLNGPGSIWDALMAGIQVDPPVLHVTQHYLVRAFGDFPLIYRLPAIAGFTLMCVSGTLLLWRYVPPLYAASAFYLPYATVLRSRAMDARPYGLMFGFAALTLLCWDSVHRWPDRFVWRAAFTFALSATLSTHFYSIYILLALAAGELTWWVLRRRIDWLTIACAVVACIPYGFWLPVLLSASKRFMSGYFYRVNFQNLYDFYSFGFATLPFAGIFALLLTAGVLTGRVYRLERENEQRIGNESRVLLAAAAAFTVLPVIGYLAGLVATGFFVPYYHMMAVFGVVIGLPLTISAMTNRSRVAAACLMVAIAGHGLFVTARGLSGFRRQERPYPTLEEIRRVTGDPKGDVVIASPAAFLPFHEATRFEPDNNLLYLADPAKAKQLVGTNTADLVNLQLPGRTNARIEPFDAYVKQHRQFYLAVLGPAGVIEWQFTYLQRSPDARLQWLGKAGEFDLYQVNVGQAR